MEKMEQLYEKAFVVAKTAHEGQKDKGGHPYFEHPLRVANGVETMELKIVALLHDVLEDTSMTKEELEEEGFPAQILKAVCDLTRQHNKTEEEYMAYIGQLKKNPIAARVKMADLKDNMDLSRIANPTKKDFARMEKYKKAYAFLQEE